MQRPPRIDLLSPDVVRRIAAGETIERSAAALKELLENSLDAGATQIDVLLRDAWSFRLRDDGCGIRFDDLSLLCRRHATSKLVSAEELATVATLGFRGEALCSVSCCAAKVTVVTRPLTSSSGMRVEYRDGEATWGPEPCPAVPGTTICVDGLFEEDTFRRSALRPNDEIAMEIDTLKCFALHWEKCGFEMKRGGGMHASVCLCVRSGERGVDRIAKIFGGDVAASVMPLERKIVGREEMECQCSGWVAGGEYKGGRRWFVLFVNDRLVECLAMKRALFEVYAAVVPRSIPFVYLNLKLPRHHVDVNVHPAKREVEFLFRSEIVRAVAETVWEKLTTSIHSRTVRTVGSRNHGQILARLQWIEGLDGVPIGVCDGHDRSSEDRDHEEGRAVMEGHCYIGMTAGRFVFVEFQNGIYLLDMTPLSHEFFSQQILKNLGKMKNRRLVDPPNIADLILMQYSKENVDLRLKDRLCASKGEEEIQRALTLVHASKGVLKDDFSIEVSDDGQLIALPCVLEEYPPNMTRLPSFLHGILKSLEEEAGSQSRMQSLANVVAELFCFTDVQCDHGAEQEKARMEQILLPAMKKDYFPSTERIADGSLVRLTTIKQLCLQCGR